MSIGIPLTRGEIATIDACDLDRVSRHKWSLWTNLRSPGRYAAVARICSKTVYLHRFILQAGANQYIDHIDRNPLNNTRNNLRFCSSSQNAANTERPLAASGYRGVRTVTKGDYTRYHAEILFLGARKQGPYRQTAVDAACDYDGLAKNFFGEFATLNFPTGDDERSYANTSAAPVSIPSLGGSR